MGLSAIQMYDVVFAIILRVKVVWQKFVEWQ